MFALRHRFHKKTLTFLIITVLLFTSLVFAIDSPDVKIDFGDFSFYNPPAETQHYPIVKNSKVKNIIFCIGDGMGLGQINLARLRAVGLDGKLYMEKMPFTGLIRTHSANETITDSAAAATAMATGFKTENAMIGITPDGKKHLTILEAARNKGLATGLVVTSRITHATPAAFAAHVKNRKMEKKIAKHLIKNKVNVIMGGGREYFLPKTDPDSKRTDNKNLITKAKNAGYVYVETAQDLKNAEGPYLLGLFQLGPLTTNHPEPSLSQLTKKAIEILSKDEDGFFLMIEASQIDWAGHANDFNNTIKQTLLFDLAVKTAIDFALADKHTLVVVTADHETGGIITMGTELQKKKIDISWAATGHTSMPVILYAFGPHADKFTGLWDNTQIPVKFAEILAIKPFPK